MLVPTLYLYQFFYLYISESGYGADMKVFAIFREYLSSGAKWLASLINPRLKTACIDTTLNPEIFEKFPGRVRVVKKKSG